MCLIDTKRFRFTFKKIPVYKVLDEDNRTPYRDYKIRKRNFCFLDFPEKFFGITQNFYHFNGGFFHAFMTMSFAKIRAEMKNRFEPTKNYKVIEGYIPAFTRYAIGQDGDICARRMVLNI